MNLGTCLNLEPVPQENNSRFLILKSDDELSSDVLNSGISTSRNNVALLVNRIGEVIHADEREVEPSPAHVSGDYISGVIKLENELLTLLSTSWLCRIQDVQGGTA